MTKKQTCTRKLMGAYLGKGRQFHAQGRIEKRNAMFAKYDELALTLYRRRPIAS